jgi:arylsulfatase A-like enzyme
MLKFLFISIILIFLITGCDQPPASNATHDSEADRPNVLFIICDDLNDYPVTFMGHPQAKTPNIDQLAVSGTTFTNAHSNVPVCQPSRNSLFTGVYPHSSKDFGWTENFEQDVLQHNKTLMEYLAENGYHVAGSGKLLHVNKKEYWHEWGVDINNYGPFPFNGKETVGHPSVPEPFRSIGPVDGSYAPLSDVPVFPDHISGGNRTGWVYDMRGAQYMNYTDEDNRDLMPDEMHAQWAVQKIRKMEEEGIDQPFFMGIGFVKPHTPLHVPKRFFDMFPLEEIELSLLKPDDSEDTYYKDIYPPDRKGPRYYRTLRESYNGDTELGLKHFLQAYLACVAFVDEQIGVVVDALNNSEFKDNTIIIMTSDHGWQMGEKDYLFKNSPWEESTRIPLIIKAPGVLSSQSVDHPVSLIDIFPTLTAMCQLKGNNKKNAQGAAIDGFSLWPFLEDPETMDWDGPEGALTMLGVGMNQKEVMRQTYTYRTRDWRYIRYLNGQEELYDLLKDPYEWENLADINEFEKIKKKLNREMMGIINNNQ